MADAKQGKTEDFYNGSSQSRAVLAKPRLGGFGASSFASNSSKSSNPFGSVLRPPQLKANNNPFLKVTEPADEPEKEKEKEKEPESTTEDRLKENKDEADAPKFVPLGSTNATPRTANQVPTPAQPATSSSSGFVFGQNLSERVVMHENVNNGEASSESVDHSSTNGTTELLFTNAAASVKENSQDEPAGPSEGSSSGSSLAAAAAEYERSHARVPPPTTYCTFTGEEDETNVLQISCRLFAWECGSWRERGRGVLRLNDTAPAGGGARLVARVAGSLRVLLNTKLWPDMVVERAGTKSLRITAADALQQVKLFLIMGAPGDIIQLHRALTARIATTKRTVTCSQNSTSQKAAERLEAATDESEYLDKPDDEEDEKQSDIADKDNETDNNRLDADPQQKTEIESHVDDTTEEKETKNLKRKEPAEEETSPKRQCPEILIE